ncbi:Zinc finger BED domain-containing protein 4 [Merluccius polli]|uniref:Zinc finger BED domain-containing protein 4 n=1 Tax=Merluccius polli TaxID=89951 RepID=A0AA47M0K9_MERPO|nr:Zinc finger BED domain-containing protein 4 [Merluccius polli]
MASHKLANARKTIGHFKHSPVAYAHLEDVQIEIKMPAKRLQQDVQNRQSVVSAETATAADVIPAIKVLKRVLYREHSTDQGIKMMKSTLLEAVGRRFSQVETEPLYCTATLVDPRYKDRQVQYFTNSDNLRHAKDAFIQEAETMELRRATSKVSEAESVTKAPRLNTASSSLSSVFDEILEESETETGTSTSSAVVQVL